MAKKSMIERELKRKKLVDKFADKKKQIKARLVELYKELSEGAESGFDAAVDEIEKLLQKLDAMPRNSSAKRKRNRCQLTGRPRGTYRQFKLSRNMLRKYAMMGMIPGIRKSSW